jgi:hypothetical protein
MSRLLVTVGLIFVCLVGAGFYFGYLRIATETTDDATHITLTVEQKKLQGDEKKAVEKVEGR